MARKKGKKFKGKYWISKPLVTALHKLFSNWNTQRFGSMMKRSRVFRQPITNRKSSFYVQKMMWPHNRAAVETILSKVPQRWWKIEDDKQWKKSSKYGKALRYRADFLPEGTSPNENVLVTFYYLVKK